MEEPLSQWIYGHRLLSVWAGTGLSQCYIYVWHRVDGLVQLETANSCCKDCEPSSALDKEAPQ